MCVCVCAPCPTPATQKPPAMHIVPRLPRKRGGDPGRDARAYIRPLGSAHCPAHARQKRRRPRDARGTPGRTSEAETQGRQRDARAYIRQRDARAYTLGSAHCPTPATQEAETQGRQRDARAYTRPLGSAHCPTPATQKRQRPRDARGTPAPSAAPATQKSE